MPGSNRAVFLDRDGTIVEDPGYLTQPEQLKLLAGAAEGIARLRKAGFLVILTTNQSAIARGMMTEQDLSRIHECLSRLLSDADPNAKLDGLYYCPFHPEAKVAAYRQESYLRKPRPGMLFKAAREHQLDLGSCWMVGDSERDVQAGKTAGCRAIRIHHDPETDTAADRVLPSLAAAAEMIIASPGRTPLKSARHEEPAPVAPPVEAATEPAEEPPTTAEPEATVEPPPSSEPAATVEPGPAPTTAAQMEATPSAPPEAAETPAAEPPAPPAPSEFSAEPEPQPAQVVEPMPIDEMIPECTEPGAPAQQAPIPADDDKLDLAHVGRPYGSTKERLLREIELEKQGKKPDAIAPPPPEPETEAAPADKDKPDRPLNTGDVRHVLAEILQQLRQLNRGPSKHDISATKILGGLFLFAGVGMFAWSMVSMFEDAWWRALIVGVGAVFLQVLSLTFFMVFRQE